MDDVSITVTTTILTTTTTSATTSTKIMTPILGTAPTTPITPTPSTATTTTTKSPTKSPTLTKKSSTTLSVDRAAFLLLRVKKAFKKKRQQRKEKQAQIASAAAAAAEAHLRSIRKVPAPLLRSHTLPAIVVPGIPVASTLHTDKNYLRYEDCVSGKLSVNGQRWSSLLMRQASPFAPTTATATVILTTNTTTSTTITTTSTLGAITSSSSSATSAPFTCGYGKGNTFFTSNYNNNNNNNNDYYINTDNTASTLSWKSLNLPKDDANFVYRRKSSGSTPHEHSQQKNKKQQQQLQQSLHFNEHQQQQYNHHVSDAFDDDLECHADGSLLLRIPAPHVVAARAYRLASTRRANTNASNTGNTSIAGALDSMSTYTATGNLSAYTLNTSSVHEGAGATSNSSSSSAGTSATALTRLAKLLHQSSSSSSSSSNKTTTTSTHSEQQPQQQQYSTIPLPNNNIDEAPRRLSWERRKDSWALQRSGSIDSFAEIVWSVTPRPSLDIPRGVAPFSKRPSASSLYSNCSSSSQNAQLNINYCSDFTCISGGGAAGGSGGGSSVGGGGGGGGSTANSRRESLLSPSSTRRNKLTRIINDNVLPNISMNLDADVVLRMKSQKKNPNNNDNNNNDNNKKNNSNNINYCDNNYNDPDVIKVHSNNCQNFRWSEKLMQNVTLAKIRTANSCTSHQLQNMMPHAIKKPTTTTVANKIIEPANCTDAIDNQDKMFTHSNKNPITLAKSKITTTKSTAETKNNKLSANNIDMQCLSNNNNNINNVNNNLNVQRSTSNVRSKGIGNTPHRNKMSKKQLKLAQAQLDKLTQINLHQHALFSAVEHGHLDKARTILESTDVDVNSINTDGLSPLDVAVLSNNRSMTRMLLQHGALEGSQFSSESIGTKLNNLLKDAESRIHDLSDCLEAPYQSSARSSISSIIIGNTGSSVTGCTGSDVDKQIGIWERRVKGLRRMLLGWDQAQTPDAPSSVTVDVTGENNLTVQVLESFEGAIGTKFKVQWSTRADFSNIVGEYEAMEWTSYHGNLGTLCYIGNLTQGRRYYIRAACGNVKGWGPYKNSIPSNVIPSSWKDLNNREDRYVGRQRVLDNLFTAVKLARPADVSELTLNSGSVQKRNPKKKTTIKQLFSVASKFQKNLRRGIYLASIIYCEDKVLVTSEDFLPVIEIDENYPSTLHSDYHWLMKVAFTWDNVKSLRTDMERNLTSTVHFRTKLLAAICQMQSALGLTDLGQLYYKPLKDSHGTVVLTCIQSVKSQKTISILNSRWLPVNKLQKKIFALLEDYNISEMLIASVSDQMQYHQASMQRLAPGLYLGYLKMQCSVEQIQVVVPISTPNVLPHCKVRDNCHITAEEWQVLKQVEHKQAASDRRMSFVMSDVNNISETDASTAAEGKSEVQRLFLYDLTTAAHKLLAYMNVKADDAAKHRLYDVEVIEHSKSISFLIICPAVELTCAVPGQSELLLQRDDLISLSIQAFEMIHLRTYQTCIMQKYARLSCILDLDTALANHAHREAFSTSELQMAKERLAKLQELTSSLNAVWKSVRWLMDVIAFARDKNAQASAAMKEILDFVQVPLEEFEGDALSCKQQLLQLPIRDVKFTKSGSGRGSWPGPAANTQTTTLDVEHSRSEQNLGHSATTPTSAEISMVITNATSAVSSKTKSAVKEQLLQVTDFETAGSRKNSGDSTASQYTTHSYYSGIDSGNELDTHFSIPASRSEDTLAIHTNQPNAALTQHMRTHSNLSCANVSFASASATIPPLITVHSSSSAPYLSSGSNLSLKAKSTTATTENATDNASNDRKACEGAQMKSASSVNLRDGGLYLKTTLSALQSEMKADTALKITKSATLSKQTNDNNSNDSASTSKNLMSSNNLTIVATTTPTTTAATTTSTSTSTTTINSSDSSTGIIQVYTAYNTGLASGTSLKLHVTPKTSAREVINLVVKQLNMAVVLKGNNGPIYTPDMLDNFCLVAVIGARERCLRDDFKPLQLQNPWKKGRLYVRQKHELLAAIDHSNRKSHLI